MGHARIPTVARDRRTPVQLGRRADGRPIHAVGGADDTATTSLEQERAALIERLNDPALTAEQRAEAIEQAGKLAERIQAHNAAVDQADAARQALLAAAPVARAQAPAAPAAPAGQVRGSDGAAAPTTPPATVGRMWLDRAHDRANGATVDDYAAGTVGGRVGWRVGADVEFRALFATTNNPMNFPRQPGVVIQNDQPLTILDLIDRQSMSGTSIEWVQETTPPNAAAEVTEGSAKPEATFALTLVTDTAATIAHWVNITRQALADDNMLRGYVEGRLTYGLLKRLNGQILNGNGTAPNLRGILATSGVGTYTAAGATEAAVISIRKAKTVAQLSEYDPDGLAINPVDWEAVELSTDTQGMFRVTPNPAGNLAPRIWGLNVVATTAILGTTFGTTGGKFLVGAFRTGATLWERTGVDIFITDSHASNFTSNILTLLAEMRAALSVWRPKAFVVGTFGASRA